MRHGAHNVTLTHYITMRGTHNVTLTHYNMMHGTHNVTLTHYNMMHGTHNVTLNLLSRFISFEIFGTFCSHPQYKSLFINMCYME